MLCRKTADETQSPRLGLRACAAKLGAMHAATIALAFS